MALSAGERRTRARVGGFARAAQYDSREVTRRATDANPGQIAYYYRLVDPDGILSEAERDRRAVAARRAHMTRLALASARSRRGKREAQSAEEAEE